MPPSRRADTSDDAEHVTEEWLRRTPLPRADHGSGKDARGTVLVIGGSTEMPGGAMLAAEAALRAGAGKLQVATCSSVAQLVAANLPEARVFALPETRAGGIAPAAASRLIERAQAASCVLIGPGMIDEPASSRLVQELIAAVPETPFVLDAGAMEALRDAPALLASRRPGTLLTPHTGELAHLFDEPRESIEADARRAAAEAVKRFSAVVAVKGATTWIAEPKGQPRCHEAHNAGLGTSGSGDALSGIAAGLIARGTPVAIAACWAVFLHARAGEALVARVGPLGFLARELLAEVPRAMAKMAEEAKAG